MLPLLYQHKSSKNTSLNAHVGAAPPRSRLKKKPERRKGKVECGKIGVDRWGWSVGVVSAGLKLDM
jgi:hypothetical protein